MHGAVPARPAADRAVGRAAIGDGRARVGGRPLPAVRRRRATAYVTYPQIRRTRYGEVESDAAALAVRAHVGARASGCGRPPRRRSSTSCAINNYLQQGFGYSERPAPPPAGRAPLDAFLIDTKEGYCQHFAGAMALLLRMGGVPARVATGFSPGGFSQRRDAWIVRDTDAHAWVEAWFDELGWVTFDPTPDSTPARSQIASIEAPAAGDSGWGG